MKILTKAAWKPLRNPEFACPGLLMLLIGLTVGPGIWLVLGGSGGLMYSLISGLLILTGLTVLMKSRLGTVLLLVVLILGFYDAVGEIEVSWSLLPRAVLGLLFWGSMFGCVVSQLEFHRARRERREQEFVLPPQR